MSGNINLACTCNASKVVKMHSKAVSTPGFTENSVFTTPPLSEESFIPNKSISRIRYLNDLDKPTFSLLNEDFKDDDTKIDFLKEFYTKSLIGTVCFKILGQLSDKDLLRASHVSKTWNHVICYMNMKSGMRVKRYLRKIKKSCEIEKENKRHHQKIICVPESTRTPLTPLSSVRTNSPSIVLSKIEDPGSNASKTPTHEPCSKDLYRQCPMCQSPARTTFKQTGHCMKCQHDFCIHCFYSNDNHSPTCQVIGGLGVTCSPRKLTNTSNRRYSLGSKENRSRLKRL